MRSAAAVLGSVFAIAACSSGGAQPCTLTALGESCLNDTDCCTGWCELEGTGAYCQNKPQSPTQACEAATAFCTQDRNCCSGLCDNGQCFAGGGGGSCLSVGSTCAQADSCCSSNCMDDGQGHTWCASQPTSGGTTCGLPGMPCSNPGAPDPGECCFGLCGVDGTCSGGGGGGGGGNCGGAGAYCAYGSDCCSGQCEKVSSGSVCH